MPVTESETATKLQFERTTVNIGAYVRGVGLKNFVDEETATALRRSLREYGVLFFEFGDHFIEASDFRTFASIFGEVEERNGVSSDKQSSGYIDSQIVPMKEYRVDHWHTDATLLECPPQAALLTPVELPVLGGDTMWASMHAAWEALSSHHQRLLEDLEVVHSTARMPFLREKVSAIHPAVINDDVTGRKLLYVNSNFSERIVGMSEKESNALLDTLFAHVNTPEFHVRLRWKPGTIAVWEERATQHRGVSDFTGPRKLRRHTIKGGKPGA